MKPIEDMTPAESYAQKLADMTGRTICCVEVKHSPRADFSMVLDREMFAEMTADFFDSLGPITMVHPNDQTS